MAKDIQIAKDSIVVIWLKLLYISSLLKKVDRDPCEKSLASSTTIITKFVYTLAIDPALSFLETHRNIHTYLDAKVYVEFIDSRQMEIVNYIPANQHINKCDISILGMLTKERYKILMHATINMNI